MSTSFKRYGYTLWPGVGRLVEGPGLIPSKPIFRIKRWILLRFTWCPCFHKNAPMFRLPQNGVLRYCSSISRISSRFSGFSATGS